MKKNARKKSVAELQALLARQQAPLKKTSVTITRLETLDPANVTEPEHLAHDFNRRPNYRLPYMGLMVVHSDVRI